MPTEKNYKGEIATLEPDQIISKFWDLAFFEHFVFFHSLIKSSKPGEVMLLNCRVKAKKLFWHKARLPTGLELERSAWL